MPNIDQIKYYVETASCLSFRKAAENLYITQPTLSRQMTNLEEEFFKKRTPYRRPLSKIM